MIFEDIQKAFNSRMETFSVDNFIPFCAENIDCPTSTDTPYLAGFLLLAPVFQGDLGVNEFRQGVFQVDINYASHTGSAESNKMADLLNSVFFTGGFITRNEICAQIESVDLGPLIVQDGWAKRPLSINFNVYTQRIQ